MTADQGDGWHARRGVVPFELVRRALLEINGAVFAGGITAERALEWSRSSCWLPELAETGAALKVVRDHVDRLLGLTTGGLELWTQIVLQFPRLDDDDPGYHRDDPEPHGRPLRNVVAVPLSRSGHGYGGLRFREQDPRLAPGDLAVFDPDVEHHGGCNTSGLIRYGLYFRAVA